MLGTLVVLIYAGPWEGTAMGQSVPFSWTFSAGSTNEDFARALAVDTFGNIYAAGFYGATTKFGDVYLTVNGGFGNIVVLKFDAQNSLLWAKGFGGVYDDSGHGLACDSTGNVYMTGSFGTGFRFGEHYVTNRASDGSPDMFVLKLDPSGTPLWAKSGGGGRWDNGNAIAVDRSGNCLVTGVFYSPEVNFSGNTLTNTDGGNENAFVARYDSTGALLWLTKLAENGFGVGNSVATDTAGACYVAGYFSRTNATFGHITLTNKPGPIYREEAFVAKIDAGGNVVWAKGAGGVGDDKATGVVLDSSGNVYVTGYFASTNAFFDNVVLTNRHRFGRGDVFLAKYDRSGNLLWVRSDGGEFHDVPNGIAIDDSNNVYVAGSFESTNASFGRMILTNGPNRDTFVAKYNDNGEVLWAKQAFSANALAVTAHPNGGVYIAGEFIYSNAFFDTFVLTNAGRERNFFIAKIENPPQLRIEHKDGAINVSWPTNQAMFSAETASAGYGATWSRIAPSFVSDGRYWISNWAGGPQRFFRLRAEE